MVCTTVRLIGIGTRLNEDGERYLYVSGQGAQGLLGVRLSTV